MKKTWRDKSCSTCFFGAGQIVCRSNGPHRNNPVPHPDGSCFLHVQIREKTFAELQDRLEDSFDGAHRKRIQRRRFK